MKIPYICKHLTDHLSSDTQDVHSNPLAGAGSLTTPSKLFSYWTDSHLPEDQHQIRH